MSMYPEDFVQPMREELTSIGFREMRTTADVKATLGSLTGTTLLFVNSICGCAAGRARPAVALALKHPVRPDLLTTVFAGQDPEATAAARSYFPDYEPSSPSIGLLSNGRPVFMLERHQIEGRVAAEIAADLTQAF
ncbi:MAG TPA: BrxA/BrxB family bacilliredoxin, partial [Terriglobia bacterium]|nr:BrxA/BrxB family bacilliredoxin [Terriglobia bacterium]